MSTLEKFKCIECGMLKHIKHKVYMTNNWCTRCYENETLRSFKEDSSCIIGEYPCIFSRPQKYKLNPDEYEKYGYI
jgi:hypothetical protein